MTFFRKIKSNIAKIYTTDISKVQSEFAGVFFD